MRVSIKMFGLLAVLVLAMGFVFQGTAKADPPTPFPAPGDGDTAITVTTHANVTGLGTPPEINYKWENVDMVRTPAGVFNYFDGSLPLPGLADDDPAAAGLQFWPWLGDSPEKRQVRYWAAVSDPNGIADISGVWVDVFHPDGTLKYERAMNKVACGQVGSYDAIHVPPVVTLGDALLAAVDTDQLTQAEAEEIVVKCYKEEKAIYMWQDELSKEQPSGTYTVKVYANDAGGNTSLAKVNTFQVLSIVGLVIDFGAGINFGPIMPGTEKVISGDELMTTPLLPTVKNIGNDPMYLWLHWNKMVGATYGKEIKDFDASFQGKKLLFTASVERGFCDPLGSNEQKELNVSVEPPTLLATDTYTGSVIVQGAHQDDPECPRP